jgi:hypothetical protein
MFDAGWIGAENLVKILATAAAESDLYTGAFHYNEGGPMPGSTDWGPYQLNDGNIGGKPPVIGADGMPHPVAGGSKSLAEVQAFAKMACDPVEATKHARAMFEARGFQPWVAYNSGAWKNKIALATLGVCNMFREMWGAPLL